MHSCHCHACYMICHSWFCGKCHWIAISPWCTKGPQSGLFRTWLTDCPVPGQMRRDTTWAAIHYIVRVAGVHFSQHHKLSHWWYLMKTQTLQLQNKGQ
jgi:hypothetical protein